MPYISSPEDGTQIWYELVDEAPVDEAASREKEEATNATTTTADDETATTTTTRHQGGGGSEHSSPSSPPRNNSRRRKRPRLVFIMGMGATSGCWGPQVDALARAGVRAQALLLDNRGVGKSGTPKSKKAYSTATMARDVLACMVRLF